MHPWTMQRLAEERRHELIDAAARARAAHGARCAGSAGSTLSTRRATRFLGELLIRTGWRLVGARRTGERHPPPTWCSGARAGAIVDPC